MTEIKDGKLSNFRPQKNNANVHTQRGLKALSDAYSEVGYVAPMTAAANGEVLDGSARLEQAFDQFEDEALIIHHSGDRPIIMIRDDVPDADDLRAKKISYGANRIGEIDLKWSPEQLLLDKEAGVDFSDLFYENELDEITADLEKDNLPDPGPQIDKAKELQKIWQTQLGQVWQIGPHRLACGDCTDRGVVERVIGKEKTDLCLFTDPPYGVKRDQGFEGFEGFGGFGTPIARKQYGGGWDKERPSQETFGYFINMTKEALIFGGNFFADILPKSTCWLVWDKLNTMPTFGDCELIWTNLGRKSVKKITFEYNGLIGKESERFHATQKPLGLISELISKYVKLTLIFDPFLGSGTTMIAAHQLNRNCVGIELDPSYVAVCLQRMADMGLKPVLAENINT